MSQNLQPISRSLLPGEMPQNDKAHRYQCYICEKTFDIFSVNFPQHEYYVCHGCLYQAAVGICRVKEKFTEQFRKFSSGK
jgi:hypothetical protein